MTFDVTCSLREELEGLLPKGCMVIRSAPGFEIKMMIVFIQVAGHVAITLVAVVSLALRIEHRLTKIETDVKWLKESYVSDQDA